MLDARAWSGVRLTVDIVVLYLAVITALLVLTPSGVLAGNLVYAAAFPPVVLMTLYARRYFDERLDGSLIDTSVRVLGGVSIAAMLMIALQTLTAGSHVVALTARLWLFAALYLVLARILLGSVRRYALRSEALGTPTVIIGGGFVGAHLIQRLLAEPRYGLRPVGCLDAHPMSGTDRSIGDLVPVLGASSDVAQAVAATGARHVILAFPSEPDHTLIHKVRECQQLGIEVSLVPRLFEAVNERTSVEHVGGLPLLSLRPTNPRGWQFAVKHAFDRCFALLALAALAPVMIAIAVAVRVSSPGPVFFRQRRVGRDGREFDILKFRTMREGLGRERKFRLPDGIAPGGVEGEDRRTRVGQWLRGTSFDELPQLINVLRGDMSLIGPRPERPEFVQQFSLDVARYADRHRVKSGITGWAQVNGLRGQTSIADRVEWDNFYIQNWSLRLDLRIMILTVAEVLRFREPG
ncbi:MAG: sugar transferase [Solirubrobacterales bacterium]|nr:sugar transferase [Solirubrobacterales bacterium]